MSALVDKAESELRAGRYSEARQALEMALSGTLDDRTRVEARSMLGLSLLMSGDLQRALSELQAATAAEPGEAMFRYNLARGYEQAGQWDAAIAEHSEAVRLSGGMAPLKAALANAFVATGRHGEALPLLQPLSSAHNAPKPIVRAYAQCLHAVGDMHGAIDQAKRLMPADIVKAGGEGRSDALLLARLYQGAMYYADATHIAEGLMKRDPGDGEAAALLAPLSLWTEGPEAARAIIERALERNINSPELMVQLLGYNDAVDPDQLAKVRAIAQDGSVPLNSRAELLLALAQYHDRAGDTDQAWDLAQQGNALAPVPQKRDWRGTLKQHVRLYREMAPVAVPKHAPPHFYLCGAPRSGQSLVQSILSAAPEISSAGERGALLPHLLWRTDEIAAMQPSQRASLYAELEQADRRGLSRLLGDQSKLIVDKNPSNLAVAGSIARVHPRARFGASLRDPADVALSIYLRGFSAAYDYASDFGAIIDHLDYMVDAIAAWRDAGLEFILLDHTALVAEPEGQSKRLFGWLGIEWDEAYLKPENRTQPIPTFSAAQVRKPVGKGGSRGAAPYAAHIAPFADRIEALREKQTELLVG
uniref:tetratricopeptide repeat-containing sulfotransferase family protein n=1 Tax=Parerythrobacter lutipelagi TaxID=1964208 RepID=UPI0010F62310|nr:tetratricopeptide repeat-containing sulfotransferase family protein [Parerythrobacter lutipelagi]